MSERGRLALRILYLSATWLLWSLAAGAIFGIHLKVFFFSSVAFFACAWSISLMQIRGAIEREAQDAAQDNIK